MIDVSSFIVGPLQENAYLLVDRDSGEAVFVDPGAEGERLVAAVEAANARLTEIWLTHAHFDHVGNLGLFPESRVHVAAREVQFWTGPHRRKPLFHHSVEEDELDHLAEVVASGRAHLTSGRTWVAPGVEMVEVGGHTPGMSMVRVRTAAGWVLLTSDAVHYYEECERAMPFTSVADIVGMYDAFDTIHAMVDAGEVQHVVAGHDPGTLARLADTAGATVDDDGLVGRIGGGTR